MINHDPKEWEGVGGGNWLVRYLSKGVGLISEVEGRGLICNYLVLNP